MPYKNKRLRISHRCATLCPMWMEQLESARRRLLDLDVERELESRVADVACWRKASLGAMFFSPLPLLADGVVERRGRWLTDDDEHLLADLVGLDDQQRPLVVFQGPDPSLRIPRYLWRYDIGEPWVLEDIDLRRWTVSRMSATVDGTATVLVTGQAGSSPLTRVRILRYDGPRLARTETASVVSDREPVAAVRTARWGPDGRRWQILEGIERVPLPAALTDASLDQRLAGALARASTIEATTTVWDGRISAPEPWPTDTGGMAASLADAYANAILSAVPGPAGLEWIDIRITTNPGDLALPPRVMAASSSFVASLKARNITGLHVIGTLWSQEPGADAVEIEIVDALDEPALHAGRAISTALGRTAPPADDQAARDVLLELVDVLADRLGQAYDDNRLPLALIHPEGLTENPTTTAFNGAERTIGSAALDRFVSILGADSATD